MALCPPLSALGTCNGLDDGGLDEERVCGGGGEEERCDVQHIGQN